MAAATADTRKILETNYFGPLAGRVDGHRVRPAAHDLDVVVNHAGPLVPTTA